MTLEIIQTDAYGNTVETPNPPEPNPNPEALESATDSNRELWVSIQTKNKAFFENASIYISRFFKDNQQLLTTLGLIYLGIIALDLLFAGLNAIDGLPLVAPILKLVGLYYVGQFIWRYLIREHDRRELMESVNRTKAEILGNRN
ncbi:MULTISPECIES: CAAD domain-containing protein [unclassified Chamaesiphon]|uniref:CAAD domain-containing protein n=1 Tax=unclassified Chamaesiphon TaxID=2620921 RepID=UPI00286CA90D|nr:MULTISPECIES: CAAD domain-containing protein [unclassified Chamaesiphon]